MALFGKKAKDTTLEPPAGAGDDGAAQNGAVSGKKGKKVRAAREPKPVKNKVLKNGVAVGLNIGNSFIKAVEVSSKNGELSVTSMGVIATPPESYANGNVLSVSALSGAIKELWRGAGIKSKVAVTSVAGTGALVVRVIEVPKMTDGELSDNMKVDADRYIPFPPSEVVMDFKALRDLPSDPDAPNMEVLLAAAQREVIDLHIKVVQSARLDPRAIDVEPIAATRALQLERRGTNEVVDYNEVTGVINLGATGAEISILRGDIVVFTRAVPNGGDAVTQAIADGLGIPFADAETVKIQSADALAPAGYNAAAGEDFNFGDEGGEAFDFGGEEFSGGDLNQAFDAMSANPPAASDDPFDLDFFNQGPKNDEPGAGHAQKEGEASGDPAPAFSFDFEAPAQPAATPEPSPAEAPPAASSSFDFAFPSPIESAAPDAPAGPPNFGFGAADDFDTDVLPSMDLSAGADQEPEEVVSTAGNGTAQLDTTFDDTTFDDTTFGAPADDVPAPSPVVSQEFGGAMPSAFDFDNFDLPATSAQGLTTVSTPLPPTPPAPAPLAPPAATDAPPAPVMPVSFDFDDEVLASKTEPVASGAPSDVPSPPISFGFDDESLASKADAPQGLSLQQAPVVSAVPADAPVAAGTGDFDLDSIFGATPTPDAPVGEQTTISEAPVSPEVLAGGDDFDLDAIGAGAGDDFGLGVAAAGDFDAFGAGLTESEVSTDAATLYGLIYPPLEELSNEVRRSLEFHLGRYPDAAIARLVLLGGGAKLRNLDVFFTQMLGVPTTVANPFAYLAVQMPKLPPEYATENGPVCAVALGLALRDFVD